MTEQNSKARLRELHGLSALLILVFIVMHIGNHMTLLWGFSAHQQIMAQLRNIYRTPAIEVLLLVALLWQIASGSVMIIRGWKSRSGLVGWAQAVSGLYLVLFLVNHVLSVGYGRYAFDLDTDIRFAAAGFHAGYAAFFFPYYFLAIVALFTHLACAVYWLSSGAIQRYAPVMLVLAGIGIGAMSVLAMAGEPVTDARYLQSYL